MQDVEIPRNIDSEKVKRKAIRTSQESFAVVKKKKFCDNHVNWTFQNGNRVCGNCGISPYHIAFVKDKQPQSIMVYKRNIKNPVPTVHVQKNKDDPINYDKISHFLLTVTLVRASDNSPMESKYLTGNVEKRIDHSEIIRGKDIEFTGLKVMRTSNQEGGTNFFLQFTLCAVMTNQGTNVHVMNIIKSKPIEVKSHTHQLKNVKNVPSPIVEEVIPSSITNCDEGNTTKIVILGKDFLDSKFVKAKIGDQELEVEYKCDKTLVCEVPKLDIEKTTTFDLKVSNNNGKKWSKTSFEITVQNHFKSQPMQFDQSLNTLNNEDFQSMFDSPSPVLSFPVNRKDASEQDEAQTLPQTFEPFGSTQNFF